MKKLTKVLTLALCAAMLLSMLTGCGTSGDAKQNDANQSDAKQNEVKQNGTEQNEVEQNEVEQNEAALNAYTATYEEVVALLKAQDVIKDTETAVDMNAVGGYWNDNMNGGLVADPVVLSDIAKDFDGVYLVWFDADGGYFGDWMNMRNNMGGMVYMGGMYSLQLDTYKGLFGLGFGENVSEEVKTAARAAFDTLDTTVPANVKYLTSATELAMLLKEKEYLTGKDIAGYENLNKKYYVEGPGLAWNEESKGYEEVTDYKYYASFGTEAMTYGGITIFYFNTTDSFTYLEENLEYTGEGLAYKGLLADNKVVAYVGNADYVYTPYLEDGQEIAYTADVVCGRFAVSIREDVENKAEIVEYIRSLGN